MAGLLLGAVVGAIVGWIVLEQRYAQTDDKGFGLYAGGLIGCAGGFVVGSAVVAIVIGRLQRFGVPVTVLLAGWLPLAVVAGAIVSSVADMAGRSDLGMAAFLFVALVLAGASIAGALRRKDLMWAGMGLAVLTVVVGSSVGPIGANGYRLRQLQESELPLALVDESALAAELPGWTVSEYERPVGKNLSRATIDVETASGYVVEIEMRNLRSNCDITNGSCHRLQPLSDGSPVTWLDNDCKDQSDSGTIVVERPGGSWTVRARACRSPGGHPTAGELERLLTTIASATPEEWSSAASS